MLMSWLRGTDEMEMCVCVGVSVCVLCVYACKGVWDVHFGIDLKCCTGHGCLCLDDRMDGL